jgi:hypothetical protein
MFQSILPYKSYNFLDIIGNKVNGWSIDFSEILGIKKYINFINNKNFFTIVLLLKYPFKSFKIFIILYLDILIIV